MKKVYFVLALTFFSLILTSCGTKELVCTNEDGSTVVTVYYKSKEFLSAESNVDGEITEYGLSDSISWIYETLEYFNKGIAADMYMFYGFDDMDGALQDMIDSFEYVEPFSSDESLTCEL